MNNTKLTSIFRRVTSVGVLSIALLGCILGIVMLYHAVANMGNWQTPALGIHGVTWPLVGITGMGITGSCVHIAAYAMLRLRA